MTFATHTATASLPPALGAVSALTPLPTPSAAPKVAVLLNAHARQVGKRTLRALSHALPEDDTFLSHSEWESHRIVQSVLDKQYDLVFLGGGDGTLSHWLSQFVSRAHARKQRLPKFGVLKLGTGNAVASYLGARDLKQNNFVEDVLRARAGQIPGFRSVTMIEVDQRLVPFAGVGVDGRMMNDYTWVKNKFARGPLSKVFTGPGGYFTCVALKTLPHYLLNSTRINIEVQNGSAPAFRLGHNGKQLGEPIAPHDILYRGPVIMAAASAVPYYGFEVRMFPFAAKRPGHMSLRLADVDAPSVLANIKGLWRGTWFPKGVHDFHVQEAVMRFSSPMPLQIAGDAAGYRDEVRLKVAAQPVSLADFSLHRS